MFKISPQPLDPSALEKTIFCPQAGGLASYSGWVRDEHFGMKVTDLHLRADFAACQKEGENILNEAKDIYDIERITFSHRVGELTVGDFIAWVGASAPHRQAAFDACRFVVDQMKMRLPIDKKEFYADTSDSGWLSYQEWIHYKPQK